ncbi:P27 family phage terminase small subunit [Gehongia tenuis]|uniref:P27 family phage terminase small subunit n=1 Tax=Gehongia tenuis TaxID=2763655 RepID=A0A926D3K7_9FIRM|nr:P27 family phage terminase small subunit [Gehongia tenuis]MBC8531745.1 P27 family phage terminase small subunit [Gehongia tenuis]
MPRTQAAAAKARLLKWLKDAGNYQDSDMELVDLYAETYDFYQRLRAEVSKNGMLYDYTNKAGATNKTKNPLIIEMAKAVQTLNGLLKSMGLTPAQRKAFGADAAPSENGGDEFDDY